MQDGRSHCWIIVCHALGVKSHRMYTMLPKAGMLQFVLYGYLVKRRNVNLTNFS